jgi:cell division protein FtsB
MASDELLLETEPPPPRPVLPPSPWPAVALLVLAVLIWFGYQAWNLQREYQSLRAIHAGQETALEQARRRQAQLETTARRVYALSQQGHPNATLIVQELARRGVNFAPGNPPTAPSTSDAPAAPAAPTK